MSIIDDDGTVLNGRSLVHRRLSKAQRACTAANLVDGTVNLRPTVTQVTRLLSVSPAYVRLALKFSPGKRAAILRGDDHTSFSALLCLPERRLALPAPIDDRALVEVIKQVGVERMLDAAVAVEQGQLAA